MRTLGALVAAGAIAAFGGGSAYAEDVSNYAADGTVYFNIDGFNCSIASDSTTGCDVSPPAPSMLVAVGGVPIPVPYVPAMIIDSPALPGHPQWVGAGSHTLPGGNPPAPYDDVHGYSYFNYAGASCRASIRGGFDCTTKGHRIGASGYNGQLFGN